MLDAAARRRRRRSGLADLWLDEVTSFPTGMRSAQAWSSSEWVEETLPVWSTLCDPIAEKAVEAMGGVLAEDPRALGAELPGELSSASRRSAGCAQPGPGPAR